MKTTTDFWVGDRVVRPSLGEIRLGMERVHLEPRSMEVLLALVERAPQVVPKQELIAAVWGEAFVSDEVLTHAIWDLRRALGDHASDPEFIQTIPKRGYRLIAPVKRLDTGELGDGESDPAAGEGGRTRPLVAARPLIWGLVAIALLVAAALWLGGGGTTGLPPVPATPAATPAARVGLTLVPTEPFPGTEELVRRLDSRLLAELTGVRNLEVRQAERCVPVAGVDRSYSLESTLLTGTEMYDVSTALVDAESRKPVYSPPAPETTGRTGVTAAAREIAEQVVTFFEVVRHRHFEDPDVRPWFSLQRHDIRAIRDFLHGVPYVYRNEIGGRNSMATAAERDPGFVAPRVWRTPTLLGEADDQALSAHRTDLARLFADATGFEKAMIGWVLGLMDGDPAVQARQLEVALELEPTNRPARVALAAAHTGLGDLEEAWRLFDGLLASGWDHPGLYPAAAECAFALGRIDDARRALEMALEFPPVDPVGLALLQLLALYEEDADSANRYRQWLDRRLREMSPETVELDLSTAAGALAARAESEGRPEIAKRMRESAI